MYYQQSDNASGRSIGGKTQLVHLLGEVQGFFQIGLALILGYWKTLNQSVMVLQN